MLYEVITNDGSTTAPSKRLDDIIDDYSKVVYGSLLAQEIGLKKIQEKCPRFNAWINKLLEFKDRITSYNVCYTKLLRRS